VDFNEALGEWDGGILRITLGPLVLMVEPE
jgi:hypothetical protein